MGIWGWGGIRSQKKPQNSRKSLKNLRKEELEEEFEASSSQKIPEEEAGNGSKGSDPSRIPRIRLQRDSEGSFPPFFSFFFLFSRFTGQVPLEGALERGEFHEKSLWIWGFCGENDPLPPHPIPWEKAGGEVGRIPGKMGKIVEKTGKNLERWGNKP